MFDFLRKEGYASLQGLYQPKGGKKTRESSISGTWLAIQVEIAYFRVMHLVLVRHGEVDSAFSGVFYGGTEVPLSAHGRQEAETAAHFLAGQEPIAIYSSPLTRAQYGAACVLGSCNSGGPLRIEAGLKEIDRGRWVGLSKKVLMEQ